MDGYVYIINTVVVFNLVLKKKIQLEGKIFSIEEDSIHNSNYKTELIQVD